MADALAALRSQIKAWERSFLGENGRKPARKDIASNAYIATKYKEYERLKSNAPLSPSRKRKASDQGAGTPPKKVLTTPRKQRTQDIALQTPSRTLAVHSTPGNAGENAEGFTPVKPLMLGPTPHREGIPIGIFDHLAAATTPSRDRSALTDIDGNTLRTPSKVVATPQSIHTGGRHARTPMSEGRRFFLDQFITPRKNKVDQAETPSSIAKHFRTPTFLRRHTEPLTTLLEEAESPERAKPWQRPKLFRGLSSIIRSRRADEEERLDEEEDVLRQLEQDGCNPAPSAILPSRPESQPGLDADGFVPSDVHGEIRTMDIAETQAVDGSASQKMWKKKGQKRTTKRVIMRPVRTRVANIQEEPEPESSDEDGEKDAAQNDELEQDGDVSNHDEEDKTTRKTKLKNKTKELEPAKKKGRKINAEAHANYRKLKIKNKNSKANGRRTFGRRR